MKFDEAILNDNNIFYMNSNIIETLIIMAFHLNCLGLFRERIMIYHFVLLINLNI